MGTWKPPTIVKNPSSVKPDITIMEVGEYCTRLLDGDTRCVECLFAHPSIVLACHKEAWGKLVDVAPAFVTRAVVRHYLSDAYGAKGLQFWLGRAHKMKPDEMHKKWCVSV